MEGIEEIVSHDAAQEQKLELVFPARVKLGSSLLVVNGIRVALKAYSPRLGSVA